MDGLRKQAPELRWGNLWQMSSRQELGLVNPVIDSLCIMNNYILKARYKHVGSVRKVVSYTSMESPASKCCTIPSIES